MGRYESHPGETEDGEVAAGSSQGGRVRVRVLTRGFVTLTATLTLGTGLIVGRQTEESEQRSPDQAFSMTGGAVIWSLAFTDGRTLASASTDGYVLLWDWIEGTKRVATASPATPAHSMAFGPDSRTLAINRDESGVTLVDRDSGEVRVEFQTHKPTIRTLAFAPDGGSLAIANSTGNVTLWDLSSNSERLTFEGHTGCVNVVAFAPDGRTVASSGNEGTIALWDAETGRVRTLLAGHPRSVNCESSFHKALAFAPDGRTLASIAVLDPDVRLWDVATGRLRATLRDRQRQLASSLGFSADGRYLVTTGTKGITLWDMTTGRERLAWAYEGDRLTAATFSPDGVWLAVGDAGGQVSLWEMARLLSPARPAPGRDGATPVSPL